MADIEALLQPLEGENPAGPDLGYDEKRQEIERAFEASAAPDSSEAVDWRRVIDLITEQAQLTRDLLLPIYLVRAGARSDRMETIEFGCDYLAGLCENFWETMHPGLEEYGFVGRKGPCESLVSIREFIGPLRRMTLVAHPRFGRFTGEDLERFAREGESAQNYGPFRAAVAEVPAEEIKSTVERLAAIRGALARVDGILSANANGDTSTNFAPAYAAIDAIRAGLAPYFSGLDEAAAAPGEKGGENGGSAVSAAESDGGRPRGAIESREDVVKALDAVVDYYRRREPGSPVPVAIERAKRWVHLDFLAALQDIAPDSIAEARRVLTSQVAEE
ncbi:MAG TPA: type VI secretion system protein TssA [Allosphingosinicella sp.]|jgi:type VI secretion system protein ImpA